MDWKKTFNRGQWVIHGIFVIAIIFGVGSTIFALRLNHLQSTEEERGLKINGLVHHLKKDMSFEKIGKLLSWAESDKANDKMRELSQKIAETEELLEIKSSKDLSLGMRTFNRLINNTSGMSDPSDALKVLNNKVNSLKDFAQQKNYQTVELISERMRERLDQLNPKNVGGSVQVSYLRSDIKRLEQLVSGAKLTDNEKAALNSRFTSMSNEIELLSSLNSQSRDLKSHVTQASLALSQWMIDVEKKAADIQGVRFQKQNQLVIMLAGMVGFMVVAWMGLAYLFRWQKVRMGEQVEMEVKSVIEKGIIGDQRFMMDHYSDLTREDIIRLLDELKIKLNLGSMLHNGLPFAGCMIDTNFKLTWHNHLFLEQFYLSEEEVRSDAFNWDYLRDYLNLDEDPIYQALVNKIAGIYPVKVKQDEYAPSQPYEMYVTPINVNREDRVMVFFYPLVSVKEAINEQVDLSRMTLGRFISYWNNDSLDEDQIRLLEKDFKNNDLKDLYDSLIILHDRVTGEKSECLRTINELEKENQSYRDTIADMKDIEEEKKDIIRQEFQLASELRDTFLGSVERVESLLHINRTILQQNDDLKTEAQKLSQTSNILMKKTKETLDIMGQLEGVKVDYKKLKFELLEVKAKLISINNTLFGQLPPFDENQQKLANRYKDELARLDFNVTTLDKKLSQLDVLLAKLQMMHEKSPVEQTNFNFLTSQKDHELKETLLSIQKSQASEETKIIESFKCLHMLMKQDLSKVHTAENMSRETLETFLS
jgi:NTP pyrophosphatase (non-canonical NTP hydrolase)